MSVSDDRPAPTKIQLIWKEERLPPGASQRQTVVICRCAGCAKRRANSDTGETKWLR